MIATRDFFLYVALLVGVLVGATYTGVTGLAQDHIRHVVTFNTAESTDATYLAYTESPDDDKAARRALLTAKIQDGEGSLTEAPPVFTSVDQIRAAEAANATTATASAALVMQAQYCTTPVLPAMASKWPNIVEVSSFEDEIVFYTEHQETTAVGTTTTTSVTQVEAFRLPIRSVRTGFDSCLPDILIGATVSGQPLANTAVEFYTNTSAETLIGYTRDGFSIYGPLPDESVLDSCGGRYDNGVYQYHVRSESASLIACYAGIPIDL